MGTPNWNRYGYDEEMVKETIKECTPKMVALTQEEYDALDAAGQLENDTFYFIKEAV